MFAYVLLVFDRHFILVPKRPAERPMPWQWNQATSTGLNKDTNKDFFPLLAHNIGPENSSNEFSLDRLSRVLIAHIFEPVLLSKSARPRAARFLREHNMSEDMPY